MVAVAQLVERVLAKHKVVGSKPITRSTGIPINSDNFTEPPAIAGATVIDNAIERGRFMFALPQFIVRGIKA